MTTIAEKTESGAKAEHTPTPWRKSNISMHEIVADAGMDSLGAELVCAFPSYQTTANRDFILRACNSFDTSLCAMKSARAVLANLAQSDPTYEPAWRALTDAIKAAEGPMRPADSTSKFLIIDTDRSLGGTIYWWGENCRGYTTEIEKAGRYSAEQIINDPDYFNDGKETIVPSDHGMLTKMMAQTAARKPFWIRKPGALSALPTAPEGTCEQPSDAEQEKFDAENVADPYDGGRL